VSLKVPDAGELLLLGYLRSQFNGVACRCRLFQNDKVPADADVASNYTEATFTSYAFQNAQSWVAPTSSGGVAQITHPTLTWTVGAVGVGNQIYGYYITDGTGQLLWAERDPNAPINMAATGNTYAVTLALTFHSEF